MRILFIGDIFGRPGRHALREWLPTYKAEHAADMVVANVENAAGGKGVSASVLGELAELGIDAMTGGNHSFRQREALDLFDREHALLRPANLPPGAPGRGFDFYEDATGRRLCVLNLQGRAFMQQIDCPFRGADAVLEEIRRETRLILVDFHAEASSEKIGMAAWLDGRVSAVVGTHTHVPTADARISAAGTAAISDVGMTGPYDSIIGVETPLVLDQLVTGMPVRHTVAKGDPRVCAVEIDVDDDSGKATAIRQIVHPDFRRAAQA